MADSVSFPFEEDPVVEKLVSDPKQLPDLVILFGYLGRAAEPGDLRLYGNPQLTLYLELPCDAVGHVEKHPGPPAGTFAWVHRDAKAVYGNAQGERTEVPIAAVAAAAFGAPAASAGEQSAAAVARSPTTVGLCPCTPGGTTLGASTVGLCPCTPGGGTFAAGGPPTVGLCPCTIGGSPFVAGGPTTVGLCPCTIGGSPFAAGGPTTVGLCPCTVGGVTAQPSFGFAACTTPAQPAAVTTVPGTGPQAFGLCPCTPGGTGG